MRMLCLRAFYTLLKVLEIMRTLTDTESACPSRKSVSDNGGGDGSSRIVRLTFARAARMPRSSLNTWYEYRGPLNRLKTTGNY